MEKIDNIESLLNDKVLTDEEIKDLFAKFHNGDTSARDTIITSNTRLVLNYIKCGKTIEDQEDYFFVGLTGLIRATDTFKPDANIKFSTYATACIKNEICYYLSKQAKNWDVVSLFEPIKNEMDDNDSTMLIDMVAGEDDTEEDACTILSTDEVIKIIDKFKEQDQYIIKSVYGIDIPLKSMSELGKEFGCTRQAVLFKVKRILKKIKKENTFMNKSSNQMELTPTTMTLKRKIDYEN